MIADKQLTRMIEKGKPLSVIRKKVEALSLAQSKVTEIKNCPDCNVLDGEDIDCDTCEGVGTIEVPAPVVDTDEVDTYVNGLYKELRAKEYPPIVDYVDAVVKDDTEAIEAYKEACLAVKAKYPKV